VQWIVVRMHRELVHDGLLCGRDDVLALRAPIGRTVRRIKNLFVVHGNDAVVR
jgi:hypothetical protein